MKSESFPLVETMLAPFDYPLPDPPMGAPELRFDRLTLFALRSFVRRQGSDAGVDPEALEDFVTAVNEVATHSVLHGGGGGRAIVWPQRGALICEVRDSRQVRQQPADCAPAATFGLADRGLWLAKQLCDLIQLGSFPDGTVTRLHAGLSAS